MFFLKNKETKETFDRELKKTRESFFSRIKSLFFRKSKLDTDFIDHIEEILLSSDIGTETTIKIINNLEKKIQKEKYRGGEIQKLYKLLKEEIESLFKNIKNECLEQKIKEERKPYVIMMVGVNGVGKTTTIGKLAFFLKKKRI